MQEENNLESALRLAADEPAHRPDFYKLLLRSTIYILGDSDQQWEGTRTIEAGEKISIQNWEKSDGTPIIPFFTSLAALLKSISKETNYMALPARSLFEMTSGATLVLNPSSDYSKEFFPHEIEALLTIGINRVSEQRITEKATQVLLGQPRTYPSKMVDSLTTLLAKRSTAKAAFLTLMHDTSHDEKPHLVVGILADSGIEKLIQEAGAVAGDTAPDGELVDLVRVVPGEEGLSEYFMREVKPFYERSWGGKLKSFFGIGNA